MTIEKIGNESGVSMAKEQRKYYEAYEERYKTVHALGFGWSCDTSTPIVTDILDKYQITPAHRILEIGCGEGRDAKAVLSRGYDLTATDISPAAISYCKRKMPQYKQNFRILDCLSDSLEEKFDFIYAIAVVHMLVLDEDRNGFYRFLREHLNPNGLALICTMGDGSVERQSDISAAFTLQERNHPSGKLTVAATSCRMVSWDTFHAELAQNGFAIVEQGFTSSPPNFDRLMYAVVKERSL